MNELGMQASGMLLYRPEADVVGQVCQVDWKLCGLYTIKLLN
jgi:hypothetical protein